MNGFVEIVPGVMVNARRDIKVSIYHPDPAWVILNKEKTASLGDGRRTLFVFSSEELANKHIKNMGVKNGIAKCFQWAELVDKFGESYTHALIDNTGDGAFHGMPPLQKGI